MGFFLFNQIYGWIIPAMSKIYASAFFDTMFKVVKIKKTQELFPQLVNAKPK